MRPPSGAWSWWNRRLFSSVAPYTRMGMVTSPKEIAPFQIVLMRGPPLPGAAMGKRRIGRRRFLARRPLYAGQQSNCKEAGQVATARRRPPPFPRPLPARRAGDAWLLEADGRRLRVSNLDPFPPYTFADVRTVATLVKVVLDGLGLRGYPKTSGAPGMQVFVPVAPVHPYADVRAFVERVGRLVTRAYPEKATMAWPVADRAGKVFIDHQMNRAGANIASVYSLRPLPGAPVSTPLDWAELDTDLEPGDFRIDNVWDRFAAGDRFAGVLSDRQTLDAAMDALGLRPGSAAVRERERRGGPPPLPRAGRPRPRG